MAGGKRSKIAKKSAKQPRDSKLVKACCEMSRRDGAIVAWHEVPGTAPPQKSRPVGYGVIRAGLRTDSMIGVTKFGIQLIKAGSSAWIHQTFPLELAAPDHTVPYGTRLQTFRNSIS